MTPGGIEPDVVLAQVRAALGVVLEIDASGVEPRARFVDDLGADSLAMIELVEILEERLGGTLGVDLHIPDGDVEALVSVADVVGYILARMQPTNAGGRA